MGEEKNKTILIIEDNFTISNIYKKFINAKFKYDVQVEEDGQKGYEYAIANSPDLIILDLMLPSLSGYDMLPMLRSHENTKKTPIIVISALHQQKDTLECIKRGADDFMVKPAPLNIVEKKIRYLLKDKEG